MNLTDIREQIADALNAGVEDVLVRPRPGLRNAKQGDGWVTVGRMAPVDFYRSLVTFVVIVTLGSDQGMAEELLETWAVDCIDAVTQADCLHVTDVVLEPLQLVVESGAVTYAFTLTMTTEVEA